MESIFIYILSKPYIYYFNYASNIYDRTTIF